MSVAGSVNYSWHAFYSLSLTSESLSTQHYQLAALGTGIKFDINRVNTGICRLADQNNGRLAEEMRTRTRYSGDLGMLSLQRHEIADIR